MPDYRIHPAPLRGRLTAPPSKSAAHRALICAALAGQDSRVSPVSHSEDMEATLGVLAAMGSRFIRKEQAVVFSDFSPAPGTPTLDCGESGSTLRFLLPVAAALGLNALFTGRGRLPERPIGPLAEELERHGVHFSQKRLPCKISGRLMPGLFSLPGNVSSQFISGLLFALPLLGEESEIQLDTPLESAGYVEMTIEALKQSNIQIKQSKNGWKIPGGQAYRLSGASHTFASPRVWDAAGAGGSQPGSLPVEGDWSNAAFWLCAGAIGGNVQLSGLLSGSSQGDRAVLEILRGFGADCVQTTHTAGCACAPLRGVRIDASSIPDLVPILAVTASFAQGRTEICNAARLRIKERDRLKTTAALLHALGGRVEELSDGLIIHGGGLRGGEVDGQNDHRIVMSAAVAACFCREPVVIRKVEAVNKSYPEFFNDFCSLGGRFDVVSMG